MSDLIDLVAAQLSRELGAAAWTIASVAAPPDEAIGWQLTAQRAGHRLALSVCSGDGREAAQAVIDVMGALWPHCPPEDCERADWWRTPLGQACAASLGVDHSERVSYAVAGAMLGITEGSAKKATQRGQIDRHPDGGVLRSSVLQRIGRQHERRR